MADHSSIEWTDATWNPITGCSIVSPGCVHCYAMKLAGTRLKHIDSRKGLTRDTVIGPIWTGEVRLNKQWLHQPIAWKKPRKIFVCAHGDLFAENVPDDWIDMVFAVMALSPRHTFQVLTKRAKRMREYLDARGEPVAKRISRLAPNSLVRLPLPNVWLGVSAERQKEADERVPDLLATPAAIRFVSAEPLLGSIDFRYLQPGDPPVEIDALNGTHGVLRPHGGRSARLDWVIVGGESGTGARPMHPAWARSIRDQCAVAGVPFFFKQWGAWRETDWQLCAHPMPAGTIAPAKPYWMGAGYGLDRPSMSLEQVGKKVAGRLLDGVEHNEMPKVAA
ncbi:phage Gp37/Gp68 family protein [Mesorhizobium sp. M1403]|uniref:phage Gp37/Gp68 family protein n=1 Tax=Mesorhizobium sp. M1403 TaxID=2957097 RepID=UPI0033368FFF